MTYCLLLYYHLWFHQTIEQHNIVRKDHGLQIFEIDEKLMKEANDHAIWMTKNKTLQHSNIRYGAENIARARMNPKNVVELWMNSPGHRRNILNPRYTRIGVAVYKSTDNKYYWCARFK